MVGEQGNRTTGSRASGSSSVPQSYWWKRIHNLNARSRLQEVSGGLNCAEKFSSLVSCHRGYGSVAFYAVFSLFILTFLYAIWKIVSAHSRSPRRPGSSNSTSATKLNPTAHAPTAYANAHTWMKTESIIDHFPQSVKKLGPFQNEAPQQKPSSLIYFPSENEEREKITSVTNNVDPSTGGNGVLRNPSPTWPSRVRATKRFYNYYPGSFNSMEPPLNYPTVPYPPFFNLPLPKVSYPKAFYPYSRPPFPGGVNNNQNYPFRTQASSPFPYSSNSVGIFNDKSASWSYPLASNVSYIAPYYIPTKKNSIPQGSYDSSYYGENPFQDKVGGVQTSPSPLIAFLKESSNNADKSPHQSRHNSKQRKKPRRKTTRHNRKEKNRHFRKHSEYEKIEDVEEEGNLTSNIAYSTRRRKIKGNRKAVKHIKKSDHKRKMRKDRHYGMTVRNAHHRPHVRTSKRTRISSKTFKVHHAHHRATKQVQHKGRLDTSHKYRRTNIPHSLVTAQTSHLKYSRNHPRKQHRLIRRRLKGLGVHLISHERHHKILDFKLYRRYRKHHSVNDEIRGKWQISRHRVRTCKRIDTFSTRGTVKITRAVGHNRKYLHTLLTCRPVRLRIRLRHHQRRFSLKYAQLCSKRWYVTKGVIHIQKQFSKDIKIPRYNVRICDPSYAHAMKLLPTKGKETKVWSISKEYVRRLEEEDARKFYFNSSSLKSVHKHNHKKGKVRQHEKKKTSRSSKSRSSNKTPRKHHGRKTKRKIFHHSAHKTSHHLKLKHVKRTKLKKKHGAKKRKHESKANSVLGNKKNENSSNKTRGKIASPDELFYGKLLKVLKLARTYERKKVNATNNDDVFDSLETVLTQSRNVAQNSTSSKNNSATKVNVKENDITKHKESEEGSPKHAKNTPKGAKVNIPKLLAKILPEVVAKIINGDHVGGELPVTKVTSKPTQSTTTQKMSTTKATTSSQITTPSKTTSGEKSMVDIMRNILPLLLKRTGKEETNLLPSFKSKPRAKKPPSAAKQTSSKPKKTMDRSSLTSILSTLGLGNLASNSQSSTIFAKTKAVTNKPVVKSTQKSTTALLTTTLLPKNPFQSPTIRPIQTPSVVTIQVPTPLRQPDIVRPSVRPPVQKLFSPPGNSQISPPGLPPVPLAAPSSVHLPGPQPAPSPISVSMSGLQSPVSPRVINSDPYSENILCFGDSLTSGFYNHGRNFHPYSQRLSQLLNSDGRRKYYVKTSGEVGEMAHGSMARRLPQVLGNSSRFDWVIILGGTNDVAHVKNFGDDDSFMTQLINVWQPRIVRDIEILHEIAHKYGARTVLLTIPETAYEAWPSYKTLWVMRSRLNEDLRNYARRSQGNVVLCDLAAKVPRHSIPPQTEALLWNDHLHLTPYGYDKMAEIVYQCLKPYLR